MKNVDPLKANQAKKPWLPMQLHIISIAGGANPNIHESVVISTHKTPATNGGFPVTSYNFHTIHGLPQGSTRPHPKAFYYS